MLELQTYPGAFGSPSASPFGVKALCLLEMAKVEYTVNHSADPRKAPKGKLPVLIDGDKVIADSDFIREHLEATQNIDFDAGLSERDRAISRAFIRMAEEHMYFALTCDRWLIDANWEQVKAQFFDKIPALMRGFVTNMIRKKVRAQAHAQGMGRHSVQEQLARVDKDIAAVAALLDGQKFLFGDRPTAADASVAAILLSMANSPTPTALSRRVGDDAVIMAYLDRVKGAIFPQP